MLKDKKFSLNHFAGIYLVAVLLLWIKTYIVQITQFNLEVKGVLQHFLLFINPLGAVMLLLAISFLFKKDTRKLTALVVIYTLLTILLFANAVYYRFFSDFITLPTVTQTQNFGDLGGSVLSLLRVTDILYFVDVAFLIYLRVKKKDVLLGNHRISTRKGSTLVTAALAVSLFNLALAEMDRPQLLSRGFDRSYIVKYLGMYNYTLYDSLETAQASSQRALADSNDISEVLNYTRSNYAAPNEDYFGAAKDMNVVYLHLESFQTFLLDYKINGEEVTPFLNDLTKNNETLFFDNFFHQTGQGKTSDAEFMLENSLFGLPQGSAFITKGQNTYQAAPNILKDNGYTSAVFHGNNGSFWNRNVIYKQFGYDHFYDASYYDTSSSKDMAEYGLLDKPFFTQSRPMLNDLPEPFYTKLITVGNHFPYKMDQDLVSIDKETTGDASVDDYFQTARYLDESVKQFFKQLEEDGLADNTMVVLYGDHYGISSNHNKAMSQIIDKEITPYENMGLQRVPLFIHVPGMEGGVKHTYGGQIDMLPTILHLLGVDTQKYVQLGTDLLSKDHEEVVPFRNGDFASPSVFSVDEKVYDNKTGEQLDPTNEKDLARIEKAKETSAEVSKELGISDKIVNGDLLRFYTPQGFKAEDPINIDYTNPDPNATGK